MEVCVRHANNSLGHQICQGHCERRDGQHGVQLSFPQERSSCQPPAADKVLQPLTSITMATIGLPRLMKLAPLTVCVSVMTDSFQTIGATVTLVRLSDLSILPSEQPSGDAFSVTQILIKTKKSRQPTGFFYYLKYRY